MRNFLKSIVVILIVLGVGFLVWRHWAPKRLPVRPSIAKPPIYHLKAVSFQALSSWTDTDKTRSLTAFLKSCHVFARRNLQTEVGSHLIPMKAGDWSQVCQAAQALKDPTSAMLTTFFQTWFTPVGIYEKTKLVEGLFTGYYVPLFEGRKTRSETFSVPLYGVPDNLLTIDLGNFNPHWKGRRLIGRLVGHQVLPFHTREAIDGGAIKENAPVIVWLNNVFDRLVFEIQGSGVVRLEDGSLIFLGYAGENGAPYRAIANVLIQQGVMNRDNASMSRIRSYFEAHPETMRQVLNQNESFVFFTAMKQREAVGSQGTELTPGYSLAVDLHFIPIGTPLWLNTRQPNMHDNQDIPFHRLMIAQDTGGAIRGIVRGDVFWGEGEEAETMAGNMRHPGDYILLLPKTVAERVLSKSKL